LDEETEPEMFEVVFSMHTIRTELEFELRGLAVLIYSTASICVSASLASTDN
jgi:hypothetical protein